MSAVTVDAESGSTSLFDVPVSDMQSNVTMDGNQIKGTLKYLGTDNAITNVWGYGNFLCLKFTATDWTAFDSVLVGLDPSAGSGMADLKNDDTHQAVIKVTDKNNQVLKVVKTQGGTTVTDTYSLYTLTTQGAGA